MQPVLLLARAALCCKGRRSYARLHATIGQWAASCQLSVCWDAVLTGCPGGCSLMVVRAEFRAAVLRWRDPSLHAYCCPSGKTIALTLCVSQLLIMCIFWPCSLWDVWGLIQTGKLLFIALCLVCTGSSFDMKVSSSVACMRCTCIRMSVGSIGQGSVLWCFCQILNAPGRMCKKCLSLGCMAHLCSKLTVSKYHPWLFSQIRWKKTQQKGSRRTKTYSHWKWL